MPKIKQVNIKGVWIGECAVPILGGKQLLCFQSDEVNRGGTEYVRFVDARTGKELLYYDKQEWVDDPQLVMGVIMGSIQHGAKLIPVKRS